jgi:hypothetical protein
MNAAEIVVMAKAMGVTLRRDGDTLRVGGPTTARDALRPELVANKPEIMVHLRALEEDAAPVPADVSGALRAPEGVLYLPWGPYLSADDVRAIRDTIVDMVEELASIECWPQTHFDDVLTRVIRGPLADLMPNAHYFIAQLMEARAEAAARDALARRTWRMEGFDDRRTDHA